jgi:NAD(P)-dependent dehydrogenase (short-subunit alcohol dehydrogenase family)
MDQSSLASVKSAAGKFTHDRLDILVCNAGIMDVPPALSKDGFEIHLATNHLGHAMLIRELLPVMLRTAEMTGTDVRLVALTSAGWKVHPPAGIWYDKANTKQDGLTQAWARYGYAWPRVAIHTLLHSDHLLNIPPIARANSLTSSTRPSSPAAILRYSPCPSILAWSQQTSLTL